MATVFILEDDIDLGFGIQTSLELAGHAVSLYPLATDVIAAYKANPADVIVADMIIRDQGVAVQDGGLSAIWRIKEIAASLGKDVFVVAISGAFAHSGMQNIFSTARLFGADAALQKPFDPQDLIYLIEKSLKTRHQ